MHGHKAASRPQDGRGPPAADRPWPNALRSVAESMLGRFRAGAVGSALQDLLKEIGFAVADGLQKQGSLCDNDRL